MSETPNSDRKSQPSNLTASRATTDSPAPLSAVPAIVIERPSSDSDGETHMSDRRSDKRRESSESSTSKGKSKSSSASSRDDWSDMTDRDERRRAQNRIAQRKFREKTKEAKETRERDQQNQERAGGAYEHPNPDDMGSEEALSGLPWGSLSLKHVVQSGKTREETSARGSREQSFNYYDYYSGSGSGQGSGSF